MWLLKLLGAAFGFLNSLLDTMQSERDREAGVDSARVSQAEEIKRNVETANRAAIDRSNDDDYWLRPPSERNK